MKTDEENDKRNEEGDLKTVRQATSTSSVGSSKSSGPQISKSSVSAMPAFDDILKIKTVQSYSPVVGAGEKEFISKMVEKISHPQQQDRSSQMPSLDLGRQILAQQRKVAALKRKSPGLPGDALRQQEIKSSPQIKSMPQAPASPQQLIIADIVAKEILVMISAK